MVRRNTPSRFDQRHKRVRVRQLSGPLLASAHLLKSPPRFPNFNSDKMLLQTNSVVNAAGTPTPWHTPEIDASFRTMAPQPDPTLREGEARVNGAFENVIYPERVYLKTYFQLWSSESNPSVRSHVFTYDRPAYPAFDHWDEITLFNRDGPADVRIHPVLHFTRGSDLTNMVMAMLAEMGKEVIPEALGHQLLPSSWPTKRRSLSSRRPGRLTWVPWQ